MNRLFLALSVATQCSLARGKRQKAIAPIPLVKGGSKRHPFYFLLLNFTLFLATPTVAAERIYASYAVLERSISIAALEAYAKQGKIDEDLAVYLQYVPTERLPILRQALLARADITPVTISQFLYTPQGEVALDRLGQVIQTGARKPGLYAIRAALILAASDPEGLTLLNVLKKFPTDSIRLDLERALQIAGELQQIVNQTNRAIAMVARVSATEAVKQPGIAIATLSAPGSSLTAGSELSQKGPFPWETKSITLTDRDRNTPTAIRGERVFPVDLYLPQFANPKPAPVIVISHGLGSERTTFQYLAEHLASYGFAVAVPQHPGSDAKQLQGLINGTASEAAEPSEFIDRPLDIKYLLDRLADLEKSDPALSGRLNLQQVGVMGQSFGGYTSLVLAGAPIDFEQLGKDCQNVRDSWNISLLLQCRARTLPPADYQLKDERIKAAIALNPVDSSILGPKSVSQIQVPVMLIASGGDTVAPALPEQIKPFTWLKTPNKYLVLVERATHFSFLAEADSGGGVWPVPTQAIGPNPALARRYLNALSLAFFQTHVAGASEYRSFLQASYAKTISREPLPLSLTQFLSTSEIEQMLEGRRSALVP